MWFGQWLGAPAGQWWGDGGGPVPPTPPDFARSLVNIAWRPVRSARKREEEPATAAIVRQAVTQAAALVVGLQRPLGLPELALVLRAELPAGIEPTATQVRRLERTVKRAKKSLDEQAPPPDRLAALVPALLTMATVRDRSREFEAALAECGDAATEFSGAAIMRGNSVDIMLADMQAAEARRRQLLAKMSVEVNNVLAAVLAAQMLGDDQE